MSPILAGGAAIFMRDLRIFLSYRAQALTQFASVLFSLALFYYISKLLKVETFDSPDGYFAFVVIGLVILSVTQSTLILAQSLRSELLAGTFERMLLSPFGAVRSALSMTVFPMVLALITGVWTIAVAAAIFGMDLRWSTAALAIPTGMVAALSFSAIAMLVAALVVVFKQAPGMGAILGLISLVSGFYFPVSVLPGAVQWFSEAQPFTAAVDLMRHFLVGMPTPDPLWICVTKLVAFVAIVLPLSALVLAKSIAVAQRRGTIIEY
jgi:ABC-2 type transport system permease protein